LHADYKRRGDAIRSRLKLAELEAEHKTFAVGAKARGTVPVATSTPSAQQSLSKDERRKRTNDCAGEEIKLIVSRPCAEISVESGQTPRSKAAIIAHIELAEGTGEPRPPLRDGLASLNIQHTARSITLSSQRDCRSNEG
jgi:hypothetical protein